MVTQFKDYDRSKLRVQSNLPAVLESRVVEW